MANITLLLSTMLFWTAVCTLLLSAGPTTQAFFPSAVRTTARSLSPFRVPFQTKHQWLRSAANTEDNDNENNTVETKDGGDSEETTVDPHLAEFVNRNNIRDQVFSAISKEGGIKVTAVTARNLVNEFMLQHSMSAISTQALGRTVVCAILMANGIQDEQIVQITLQTTGPIRGVVAICTGSGQVRGYVGSPMLGNDLELPDAIGRKGGAVQIVKNHPDWPRPYNGITSLEHGDIDRDIGIYLAESEQRSCALAAALSVKGFLCTAAGGYLVEQLPDATKLEKQTVQENLAKLVAMDGGDTLPTGLLEVGKTPLDMAQVILEGLDMQPLQQIEPVLKCDCTEDRLVRSLRLLPRKEVEDILENEEQIEARCEFCGKVYQMEPEDVRERLEQSTADPSTDDS